MAELAHWEGEPAGVLVRLWGVAGLEVHDSVGSTNDRVRTLALAGAGPWTVVIADEQTAGRGRGGAGWHSPPGAGLWMSVLLPDPGAYLHLPLLVGVAVARGAEAVCPAVEVGIEWPNDVLVGGRKIAGVLCERTTGGVIAGVGVNTREPDGGFPAELAGRAGSLEAAGCVRPARAALARSILAELRSWARSSTRALSDDARAELTHRDTLFGREVGTDQAGPGVARGIAADGALLVERPDGSRVRVMAGSVRPL